jgi:hypothetical protein
MMLGPAAEGKSKVSAEHPPASHIAVKHTPCYNQTPPVHTSQHRQQRVQDMTADSQRRMHVGSLEAATLQQVSAVGLAAAAVLP